MKNIIILLSTLFCGCTFFAKSMENNSSNANRSVAQSQSEEAALYYASVKPGKKEVEVEKYPVAIWRQSGRIRDRADKLEKFYYANTREKSNRGIKHAACFTGSTQEIKKEFFDIAFAEIDVQGVTTETNLMGIEYISQFNRKDSVRRHFRMYHCSLSGKGFIVSTENAQIAKNWEKSEKRQPSNQAADFRDENESDGKEGSPLPSKSNTKSLPPLKLENGYDPQHPLRTDEVVKQKQLKIPTFALREPSEVKSSLVEPQMPWHKMKISEKLMTPKEAEVLSVEFLKYFLKGMDKGAANADQAFQAHLNTERFWCHMPWLNVSEVGREAIHGLTKERDLKKTDIYPETKQKVTGSNWGVGYYNATACTHLAKAFPGKNVKPNFDVGIFPNGSMSVKLLFTTAPLKALGGSFQWWAHVGEVFNPDRKLQQVRMIQIDIGLKDRHLVPDSMGVENWLMSSFYYDKNYDWRKSLEMPSDLPKIFEPFYHMRPIGVHRGFDVATYAQVEGSITNSDKGLLNGPADNSKGSCMGCHGSAGTNIEMVPGVLSKKQFADLSGKHFDFSQQLFLAKRNYGTKPQ